MSTKDLIISDNYMTEFEVAENGAVIIKQVDALTLTPNTVALSAADLARLLALLAPEPEPSALEIDLNTRMTLTIPLHDVLSLWDAITFDERSCVNYVHDADGEPFDVTGATIDALETALIRAKRLPENPCLAAARAARQTGGEG